MRERDDLIHDRLVRHESDGQRRLIAGGRLVSGQDAGQVDVVRSRQPHLSCVDVHHPHEGDRTPADHALEQL